MLLLKLTLFSGLQMLLLQGNNGKLWKSLLSGELFEKEGDEEAPYGLSPTMLRIIAP